MPGKQKKRKSDHGLKATAKDLPAVESAEYLLFTVLSPNSVETVASSYLLFMLLPCEIIVYTCL